jgi:Iron-containing redox enzyme
MDETVLTPRLRAVLSVDRELHELTTREAVATLLDVYALHLAPIDTLGGAEEWQHDPRVAQVKLVLERRFRARLGDDRVPVAYDVTEAFRAIAHEEMVPSVYDWLARVANRADLEEFLALEGGPDADFDDLVAMCQIGLSGLPKLTLAANYWDEMGRGSLAHVHTELHDDMTQALRLRTVPTDHLPLEVLERRALNGYLATNRSLQPEMLGSLGLLEVQAGPRCRRVVAAMRRLAVPAAALPFYEEHATADPRHGKDWIDGALAPVVVDHPEWAPRILRGARWRAIVNRRFFEAMSARFGLVECAA